MASNFIKPLASDIKSQQAKTLITNIVKFAFQNMINMPNYRDRVQDKSFEMTELMKMS